MSVTKYSSSFEKAKNPSTPSDVLEELSEHDAEHVREAVAGNPSTPSHIIEQLLRDKDSLVVYSALLNRSLPYEAAVRVATKGNFSDKCSLVENPKLPLNILEMLLADEEGIVRETAADCPRLPVARLLQLAESDDVHTRLGVVTNMASTFSVLIKLVNDEFPSISKPANNRIWTVTDDDFQQGLVEAELTHLVGFPRDWVMHALGAGSGLQF